MKNKTQQIKHRPCPVNGCNEILRGTQIFCTTCTDSILAREEWMLDRAVKRMRDFQNGIIEERIKAGFPRSTPIVIPQSLAIEYGTIINHVGRSIVYHRNIDAIATRLEASAIPFESSGYFRTPAQSLKRFFPTDTIARLIKDAQYKANVNLIQKAIEMIGQIMKGLGAALAWYEQELESGMTIEEYEAKELRDFNYYAEYKRARLAAEVSR